MIDVDIPLKLDRESYDRRMAEGWFRSGPVLFRANVLCLHDQIRGLVQIRLPLRDPGRVSRSAGRRFRRNRERFRIEFGPARIDDAREALYEKMKPRFMGFVSSELEPLVFGSERDTFDTRECAVYDGDALVAVSYFDVGRDAVASQLALHDPAFSAHGLGTFTLLEEFDHARSLGASYYYPGYIVPGLSRLDYKLQIGRVQFLEGTRWRRRAHPPRRVRAAERLTAHMHRLESALGRKGIRVPPRFYAGFWLGHVPELADQPCLTGMVVWTVDTRPTGELLLVELTLDSPRYRLLLARELEELDLSEGYDPLGAMEVVYETRALIEAERLLGSDDAREIAEAAALRCRHTLATD